MSGLARLLAGHTDARRLPLDGAADARTVEHAAEHAGWRFVALDTWQVEDKSGFLDVCQEAFAFPEWVGRNFDALADACRRPRTGRRRRGRALGGLGATGARRPTGVRRRARRVRRPGGLRARLAPFAVLLQGPGPTTPTSPELEPDAH